MRKFLALLALALPVSCIQPAAAVDKGDVVGVRLGCTSLEIVERQIAVYEKRGADAVNAQFQVDVENDECVVAPIIFPVEVEETGERHGPLTWDDKRVFLTPIRFGQFWTVAVESADET
jgi:hypothetical protein